MFDIRSTFCSKHGYQLGNSTVLGEINSTLFDVYRGLLINFDNPLKYIPYTQQILLRAWITIRQLNGTREINSTLFDVYRRQLNKFDNPLKYIPVESNHNIMGNFRIHILFTIWDGHWAYVTTLLCNSFDLTTIISPIFISLQLNTYRDKREW